MQRDAGAPDKDAAKAQTEAAAPPPRDPDPRGGALGTDAAESVMPLKSGLPAQRPSLG